MYNATVKTNRMSTPGTPKLSELRCCFTGRFGYRCRRVAVVTSTEQVSLSLTLSFTLDGLTLTSGGRLRDAGKVAQDRAPDVLSCLDLN